MDRKSNDADKQESHYKCGNQTNTELGEITRNFNREIYGIMAGDFPFFRRLNFCIFCNGLYISFVYKINML